MYNFIEKMATQHLSVDQTKLQAPENKTNAPLQPGTLQKDFCEVEPYLETGLAFAISAIGNPLAKWVLQLALTIVKAINTEFCTVKQ